MPEYTPLFTLAKLFNQRLLRIPDYQRGFAWTEKQISDFWSDIEQLHPTSNHYAGVLTLELVPPEVSREWDEDQWIITSKRYEPYYVVDGQQRLTTSIILLQELLNSIDDNTPLNYESKEQIKRRYICESKDGGLSKSYLFGYESNNPSEPFLKQHIFGESRPTAQAVSKLSTRTT